MDFHKVKSYLSKETEDGSSVYEHLIALVRKLVEEKPENAFNTFENISLAVKQSKVLIENNLNIITVDENERQEIQKSIQQILSLYGKESEKQLKNKDIDEDEEQMNGTVDEDEDETEDKEPIDLSKCANILQHQQLLNWAGISFCLFFFFFFA